jgi:hypothetical protein
MATPPSTPPPATDGELLFQNYLYSMQYDYEFEKEFPGKNKRPDYCVTWNDGVFLFDVKDFEPHMPLGFSAYDPYPAIREKINQGRDKFKEFKEYPCSLVLKNNGNAFVHLESPHIMLGAMYGNAGFRVPVCLGNSPMPNEWPELQPAFIGGGKMIRRRHSQNTTISALITLHYVGVGRRQFQKVQDKYPNLNIKETFAAAEGEFPNFDIGETQLGVIVWENAVARIRLSRELFTGPYDERWGCEDGHQLVVFRGEKLAGLALDDGT